MGYLKKYTVRFRELDPGEHWFNFEINNQFFSEFEKSEINEGNLNAEIKLLKEERVITLDIAIKGNVMIMCDRCLDYFAFPVNFEGRLYIKQKHEAEKNRTDIFGVTEDETEINLSQYFYESIHLSLPLKRVHPDDEDGNSTCDESMLELLKKYSKSEEDDNIDPRWNDLKNLFVERN
ncbi:MAG: YceD family protein [Bacteroidales bacterium]